MAKSKVAKMLTELVKTLEKEKPEGRVAMLEDIKGLKYNEEPVSIERFIDDPIYLGNTCSKSLFPFWRKFLSSGEWKNKTSVIFSGATGVGKTFVQCVLFLYDMYNIMCMRNPREYFGLSGNKKIMFVCVNPLGLAMSMNNAFGTIVDMCQNSDWFMQHGTITGNIYKVYRPKGQVGLKFASGKGHITGLDLYSILFDEISEFKGDYKKQQKNALDLITTGRERQSSRFGHKGGYHVFLASSKKTEQSFLEDYIAKWQKEDMGNMVLVSKPRWEILPKERFDWNTIIFVALGGHNKPNVLIGRYKIK